MFLQKDLTSSHFLIQLRQQMIVQASKRDSDSQNNSRINFSKISKEAPTIFSRNREASSKEAAQQKVKFGVRVH